MLLAISERGDKTASTVLGVVSNNDLCNSMPLWLDLSWRTLKWWVCFGQEIENTDEVHDNAFYGVTKHCFRQTKEPEPDFQASNLYPTKHNGCSKLYYAMLKYRGVHPP